MEMEIFTIETDQTLDFVIFIHKIIAEAKEHGRLFEGYFIEKNPGNLENYTAFEKGKRNQ